MMKESILAFEYEKLFIADEHNQKSWCYCSIERLVFYYLV